MGDWLIIKQGFQKEEIATNGNRFLCGNGYLGIRGTLEEFEKESLPAINLGGIYDKVGDGWREPLNAPNPLYTRIIVDGEYNLLPEKEAEEHVQQVDYRHGIVRRKTAFKTPKGCVEIIAERFAHMEKKHLICMRYYVSADYQAEIVLETGIDADVWDINGPHYDEISMQTDNDMLVVETTTHENHDKVVVVEYSQMSVECCQTYKNKDKKIVRKMSFVTEVNKLAFIEKVAAVFTSKDNVDPIKCAKDIIATERQSGFDNLRKEQISSWEELWKVSEVEIEGDKEAEEALNYSLYHLLCIAPFHSKSLSIPARGLSGQTYKGAVFWDTEMFMLDFFLNCHPEVAKTLLQYRIDTLPGAQKKASQYGYEGAFYAWESQEGGFDACSDYNVTDVFTGRPMRTYFKDKQVHISAAIVYGIMKYIKMTGDRQILYAGGAKTIVECAKFYDSMLIQKAHTSVFELRDVIGPDEYHERVNNNGYTNRMAKFVFEQAYKLLMECPADSEMAEALAEYREQRLAERFMQDAQNIYIPQPGEDGIVEQFDGYRKLEDTTVDVVRSRLLNEKEYWGGAYGVASDTQIIKQADVITWMVMFPEDFTTEQKWDNWKYYEPRTEHGSSLSACMYSILACACGHQEEAYPFFRKSAEADKKGGGKEWAGSIYIGGTHPAAAGGAYMTAVYGFGGVSVADGKITAKPQLPDTWKKLRFRMTYQGDVYEITATQTGAEIEKMNLD